MSTTCQHRAPPSTLLFFFLITQTFSGVYNFQGSEPTTMASKFSSKFSVTKSVWAGCRPGSGAADSRAASFFFHTPLPLLPTTRVKWIYSLLSDSDQINKCLQWAFISATEVQTTIFLHIKTVFWAEGFYEVPLVRVYSLVNHTGHKPDSEVTKCVSLSCVFSSTGADHGICKQVMRHGRAPHNTCFRGCKNCWCKKKIK